MLGPFRLSAFLLSSSNPSYSFPWQAYARVSPLSVATSHPLSENVPMFCHSMANHLSVLDHVGIESSDSFASVTNALPSGVWSSSQSFNHWILLRIPQTRFRLSGSSRVAANNSSLYHEDSDLTEWLARLSGERSVVRRSTMHRVSGIQEICVRSKVERKWLSVTRS